MIFTIPNDGHLNILKRLIREYRDLHTFNLVLVDRHGVDPNLEDLAAEASVLERSASFLNTPASQVFARVSELLDECLRLARGFGPDLILYDFCALEGSFVGRALGLPRWCSIPGLMGPQTDRGYLEQSLYSAENRAAMGTIERRFGVGIDRGAVELISNSLFIPGDNNLLWSYPALTPANFRDNRAPARYQFAGYLSDGYGGRPAGPHVPVVYLSFGTEVMVNMFAVQEDTREGVRRCVAALARRWRERDIEVVFVTQGRPVLDAYPDNWRVYGKVEQQEMLSRSDVFVTHGGSNSFHEAVLARVPMVVVPFFGDQALIGTRVEELGMGVTLAVDEGVGTGKSKRFLGDGLAGRIDEAVATVLADDRYRKSFEGIALEATPALAELD